MKYNRLMATALVIGLGTEARAANFITTGTPFDINATNAKTTISGQPVVFAPGMVQPLASGVDLEINVIPAAGGQEWLQYNFEIPPAAPPSIAGNVNAAWELQVSGLVPTQPVSVKHFFLAWGLDGDYYTPTSDVGVNLPIETNPITGVGTVFGEPVTGVIETVLDGEGNANTFADLITNNYSQNPATTNFFQIDELIGPVVTPEPATIAILGLGFLGLCAVRRNRAT
jgi:hypothetical protein